MLKQMCWLNQSDPSDSNATKILHLRTNPQDVWRPYTAFPQFAVPDYPEPNGSKGWATYQRLLKAGWAIVPSSQAMARTTAPSAR